MDNNQSGTDPNTQQSTGFSEDYVRSLREEAASWRTKYRELEATNKTKDIEIGLSKRGIKAKASWVEVQDGQTIEQALDAFATEFPHLVSQETPAPPKVKEQPVHKKITSQPNTQFVPPQPQVTNTEVKNLNEILKDKSLNDVKTDPKSRAQITDWYRSALSGRH